MEKMPSKGLHLFFVIAGFALGVLWGALSIGHFTKMNKAIADGDAYEAQECAKKVKMFFFIGLGVNVLFLFIRFAMG